ncbi:hypothetical protein CC1G_05060 [Coprinopsis cinerea okayama7|uniref:Yeast cell wall synthesis Kre9/Knh1-like N-terminal domain-containing protein n=1 Tax=Coprinopsis cinerea (strain Okayama-7 / 130 / ATCC MYA-4618 / FGSC 9003) TaxID=240176 RepID=A8NSQ4_COPC7|nr:hypothetical protein CC1G_05060 [Coprinopsis cinerea okayama7\|eukprot:XP_001836067.2 hypothetical protein CC1G_05060 [Coprinopsis cinerea okayama7\
MYHSLAYSVLAFSLFSLVLCAPIPISTVKGAELPAAIPSISDLLQTLPLPLSQISPDVDPLFLLPVPLNSLNKEGDGSSNDSPEYLEDVTDVLFPESEEEEGAANKNLIVINPKITTPRQDSYWTKGSRQIVTWDTDKIPLEKATATGLILLGYSTPDDDSEHLDIASGFPLTDGSIEVTVPADVASRDNYFIVLFGDSGNVSPKFTIDSESVKSIASSAAGPSRSVIS